jgi:hypothetical protein
MSITGCRNDALVKLLNSVGYQPILLPRTGLKPPELYVYDNDKLLRRGPLAKYLPKDTEMPAIQGGRLSSIEHHQTSTKSLAVAAGFLGDALKCIGITSAPKLDLSFANSRDITFGFDHVTYQAVDPADIDQLIGKLITDAIPHEVIASGYLHVVYEYAFADSLSMKVGGNAGVSWNAKAIQVGSYIDVGAEGKVAVTGEDTITFTSENDLDAAFAFKIGRLERRGKKWYFFPEEDAGQGFLADEGTAPPYLLERGVVLRVDEM